MLQPIDENDLFFKSVDHEIKNFQQVHLKKIELDKRITESFQELDGQISALSDAQNKTRETMDNLLEDMKKTENNNEKFKLISNISKSTDEIDSTKTGIRWLIATITVLAVGILLGIVLGALGHYAACATLISISGIGSAISIPFLMKNYQELGTLEIKKIKLEKKLKEIS
jgi:hypothetical protein